jgi:hypothetical protein
MGESNNKRKSRNHQHRRRRLAILNAANKVRRERWMPHGLTTCQGAKPKKTCIGANRMESIGICS